eukprot:CAMPEP_0201188912 /NCGR_PEP_ID=MMETSP0851-20130426/136620_1 /ASSEMBLY_ACC=CAM_ASM_000631 /TAXON_ID=183588 /ORGANISM="Pseudo-nitzschia fraudulenta, Strain WWA7" /LENGTH=166 /DNA_ID=CAMNT_0047474635 /DNA_START=89 /DNA_END=585 /DNA_ORIENTATION=-
MSMSSFRSAPGWGVGHNRQLNFYDEDYIMADDSSDSEQSGNKSIPSVRTNQNSATSSKSGSQFKVSEIVNPDGSVTVRSLLIQEDGVWTKQEQEIDNQQAVSRDRITSGSEQFLPFDRQNQSKLEPDGIVADQVAPSENRNYYSSGESIDENRSEAVAHRLRRQRL